MTKMVIKFFYELHDLIPVMCLQSNVTSYLAWKWCSDISGGHWHKVTKKSEERSNPICCWKPCCKLNKCWRCLFWLRMPRFKYNHYPDCNHKLPEYLLINKLSNKETRLITVEKTWRKFRKKCLETYSN